MVHEKMPTEPCMRLQDLYKETKAYTYEDRNINYGRPVDLEALGSAGTL